MCWCAWALDSHSDGSISIGEVLVAEPAMRHPPRAASYRGNVILDEVAVYADKDGSILASCTAAATPDTSTKVSPGNMLECSAIVPLTQADLEAPDVVQVSAHANYTTVAPSTGQGLSVAAQQPVTLTPQPTLQLDLDVLADTCVLKTANTTGRATHVHFQPALHCTARISTVACGMDGVAEALHMLLIITAARQPLSACVF